MDDLTTLITPDASACGKAIKLGTIDQIAPRDYMNSCLFFRIEEGTDIRQVYQHFETALFQTISDVPQLMSIIRPCNNGREEMELAFDRERGASSRFRDYCSTPLNRAKWPHGDFDQLEDAHFPYSALTEGLVYAPVQRYADGSYPGFVQQANFIPGGLILANRLHHTICDGTAYFLVTRLYAQYRSAAARGEQFKPKPFLQFLPRTDVVQPIDMDVNIADFPNWRPVELHKQNQEASQLAKIPDATFGVFYIDEEKIRELKAMLATDSYKPSSIEALCAFLWMQVVQARDIDAEQYPEAKLSLTVDARRKMTEPEVPITFFGNFSEPNAVARIPTRNLLFPMFGEPGAQSFAVRAAQAVNEIEGKLRQATSSAQENLKQAARDGQEKWDKAVTSAQEAISKVVHNAQDKLQEAARNAQDKLSEAGRVAQETFPSAARAASAVNDAFLSNLAEASRRIQDAVMAVDNTAVRRLVGLLNQMPKATSLTWNVDRWPGPDMLIVCMNFHLYNHLDFGDDVGGNSVATRVVIGDLSGGKPDGRCIFMPHRPSDGRGLEVMLQYDNDTLARLEANKDFMHFFERRA